MSLDAFVGRQVDTPMVVIKERQGSEGTIRLKCPKRIINMLGIPERLSNGAYKGLSQGEG
jgi:hypothetical protein